MVSDWRTRTLGELTENYDSIRIPVKESDRRSGPYPYYGASGIVDYVDDYLFDGEYLLIAEDGENLRTRTTPIAFLARGKFWVNNHAHVVRGNGEADTRFLMYALAATDINGYLTGSTIPKLSQGALNQITLSAPPPAEQRAIAHILGTLDDKIELNRRMNATLEAIARAIFKSWFVDFDPVHAKMRGEQPAGMDAATAALFPDAFEDSELGPIPAGWGVKTVGEIAELRKSNIRPQDFPTEFFDYYSLPAFDNGQMPAKELGENIRSNKFLIPDGCVLLSKLNPVFPKIWLPYDTTEHRSISSTEFLVMLPKSNSTREFLYSLFSSERFLAEFSNLVTGTSSSHQRVKPADFLSMKITFPKWPAIQQFTGFVVALLEKIQANQLQSLLLAELRNALLPKLISGDMQIGEYNDATSS